MWALIVGGMVSWLPSGQARATQVGSGASLGTGDVCDLNLVSVGSSKVNVIKALRAVTGLGLKDSKELVDNVPSTVLDDVTSASATAGQSQLVATGAEAEVVCGTGASSSGSGSGV